MFGPRVFYAKLWEEKRGRAASTLQGRDWFHRILLDRLFNPLENPRQRLAARVLPQGERLLDVGCWDGTLLEEVRRSGKYHELSGVDLPPEAIQTVRSKGFGGEVVDLNTDPLPFPDGYFDAVTLLAVLEHVFDPTALIGQVWRVLKPAGVLVVDVPNLGSFTNRIRIVSGRLPVTSGDPGWDGGHLHYFTKHALDRFLLSEGFEILQRRTTGAHAALREWWLSLLGGELLYLCRRTTRFAPPP